MHVSAVICTRNRAHQIGNAVSSVLRNTYPDFDLLVVDQSTDPRTGEIVQALMASHPNLRYLHTSTPGLSRAYNIGIRETTGELLAFTDDDCVAPPDWISNIVAAFSNDAEAEMLYGQVLEPEELRGHDGILPQIHIPTPQRYSPRDPFHLFGMGANFAARRRLLERIHGFDEILGGGAPLRSSQDFDFQYRAYLAGAVVLLRPEVKVDHYGLRSREEWPATNKNYGFGDASFYVKHVRCGDVRATGMLAMWLGRFLAREALSKVGLRRRPTRAEYLWAFWDGMRGSMAFPVDRRRRIYRSLSPAS
jgi:glycosyltransferase involved in cell wall biosynthesis